MSRINRVCKIQSLFKVGFYKTSAHITSKFACANFQESLERYQKATTVDKLLGVKNSLCPFDVDAVQDDRSQIKHTVATVSVDEVVLL